MTPYRKLHKHQLQYQLLTMRWGFAAVRPCGLDGENMRAPLRRRPEPPIYIFLKYSFKEVIAPSMDAKSCSTYVGHKNCFAISASRTIRWMRFPILRTHGFQSSGQAVSARRNIQTVWLFLQCAIRGRWSRL